MSTLVNDTERTNKLLYILSLVMFMMATVESVFGFTFLLMAVVVAFVKGFKFRGIKEISKSEYIYATFIMATEIIIDKNQNILLTVGLAVLSYFFIVHTICFVQDLFKYKGIKFVPCDGKLSVFEKITIVATSVISMTFFTTSSPIYKINYWGDAQMYFTFGKSINSGAVLYKDIFDHKGPYIYFIHSLAALVSKTSFIGVFFIEIIAAIVFTCFVWKTVKLFYAPKHSSILIPLQVIISYCTYSFWYGDSAEELCIPLLAIVVYIAIKAELNGKIPTFKETVVIGAISGFLFLLKFNFCALIIGYLGYVIVISIIRKSGKELGLDILAFLVGVIIPIIPVVIYLSLNGAWVDFFEVYFYENMVVYPKLIDTQYSLGFMAFLNIYAAMVNNPSIAAILCFALFAVSGFKKELKGLFLSMFAVESLIIFCVKLYIFYYSLIFLSLAAVGWLLVSVIVDSACDALKNKGKLFDKLPIIVVVVVCVLVFIRCDNLYFLTQTEEDIPQIQFAKIINETENPRILTYDIMDDGFYTYSDIIPNCKYPVYTNMSTIIPEHKKAKEEMIKNGDFDYIVAYEPDYEWENYEIVASQLGYYYSNARTEGWYSIQTPYYLYKLVK